MNQSAVAKTMVKYSESLGKAADGLPLGDNFYGPMPGGVKTKRWQTGFSHSKHGNTSDSTACGPPSSFPATS